MYAPLTARPNRWRKFDEQNDKCAYPRKRPFHFRDMQPIMGFVAHVGSVVVCIAGLPWRREHNGIGSIQAFIQYLRSFNQPITSWEHIQPMR